MQCWQFWLSAFSHQLRHGNRPSTLDPEGTPVPRSCPRKKLARTGRSTLQPAGMPALPFHAPGVGNGGVGENATFRHGLPCRGKVHRPVTGPQMRGTGGTLIKLGERHRDRGHPPREPGLDARRVRKRPDRGIGLPQDRQDTFGAWHGDQTAGCQSRFMIPSPVPKCEGPVAPSSG